MANITHAYISRMKTSLLMEREKKDMGWHSMWYQRREYWGPVEHSGSSQAFCCWSREINNQSWVSRSVFSHLPISPAALCTTTAPLHTELTQIYLKRSESHDHMYCYDIHPAQKVYCVPYPNKFQVLGLSLHIGIITQMAKYKTVHMRIDNETHLCNPSECTKL